MDLSLQITRRKQLSKQMLSMYRWKRRNYLREGKFKYIWGPFMVHKHRDWCMWMKGKEKGVLCVLYSVLFYIQRGYKGWFIISVLCVSFVITDLM